MPFVKQTDNDGNTISVFEREGKYFPLIPGVDVDAILTSLPSLPGRDDDVIVLTYPKAGTHWVWEIANMLVTGEAQIPSRHKEEGMLEFHTIDELDKLPSVRLLNTHLDPDFYPRDLIKRKCRVIYTQRNPKDVLVSYFHHTRKIPFYGFKGDWNSYYNFRMRKEGDYLRWFEWTKQWEKFFSDHPDIPVLRLLYEDMKTDLSSAVDKVAGFLGISCNPTFRDSIVEKCSFRSMKAEGKIPVEVQHLFSKDEEHPLFRKGIVGDWKNYFTVAQNERFDEEYKKLMEGYTFGFEKYI